MSLRKIRFADGEIYHIFNRGVEKRDVFLDRDDIKRFLKSLEVFNSVNPSGSIYEQSFIKDKSKKNELVEIICYCLNPNHFHIMLKQIKENGISIFMHRIGTGYTKYFNTKNKRAGSLFGQKFKSRHVDSNEYLLHLSAYINLNDKINKGSQSQLGSKTSKLSKSSFDEYVKDQKGGLCKKEIILEQFNNPKDYADFAISTLEEISAKKLAEKESGVSEDNLIFP